MRVLLLGGTAEGRIAAEANVRLILTGRFRREPFLARIVATVNDAGHLIG